MFYAQIPNGWGVSPTSAQEALKEARHATGMSAATLRREPHYVLEFPEGTEVTTNTVWGSWSSTRHPIAIAVAQNLSAAQLAYLTDMLVRAALAAKEEAA